jgi:branched-chain amino acid aminotransferase
MSFYIKNQNFVSYDGKFQDINLNGQIIYEVIRIIDSKILFSEDHISRFLNSALKAGIVHNLTGNNIKDRITELIKKNNIINGNIKFLFQKITTHDIIFYAFSIPHHYPSETEYLQGIKTTLYYAERENPQIKLQHTALKLNIDKVLNEKKASEAILVHSNGYITEGSKSNFFLIKNNTVFTSPEIDVLSGVTRKNLINLFKEYKLNYQETRVAVDELKYFETAFISGTSPKVLPVRQIDSLNFNVNLPLLRKIMVLYDKRIENYLKNL